jgi:hypothetical protein
MISSPITSMLSRGQVLQKPRDDQSGVPKRILWSTGSGRRTVTPRDPRRAMN